MPRNIRNFWVTLKVDGKSQTIATGPQSKSGGFELSVQMRDKGDIVRVLSVWGTERDGRLVLRAQTADGAQQDIVIETAR